jgi:hypothetical protein
MKSHFAGRDFGETGRIRGRRESGNEERIIRKRLGTNTYYEVSLRRRRETSTPRGNYPALRRRLRQGERFPDPFPGFDSIYYFSR